MTDAEQYDYLATVQDNLRALVQRTPPHSELSAQAMRTLNVIGTLATDATAQRAVGPGHARSQRHRHTYGVLRA
jgi:hypothetical protein